MKPRIRTVLLAPLLLVAGCDTKGCREDNSSGLTRLDALPPPAFGQAEVAGRVNFIGEVPPRRQVGSSPSCGPVIDDSVVVSPQGGLKDVLIYLDGPPATDGRQRPAATLDQDGCRFAPRTLAVQQGQPLRVVNSDPMKHNVHFKPAANPPRNLSFADASEPAETTRFAEPEPRPIGVACDIHPWMAANVAVLPHPFFAVTDADGRYAIGRVPEGEYEVVAWHERYGERREAVVVERGTAVADVTFARR